MNKFGWKGCLVVLGLIFAGWAIILGLGYVLLRGILSFLEFYED